MTGYCRHWVAAAFQTVFRGNDLNGTLQVVGGNSAFIFFHSLDRVLHRKRSPQKVRHWVVARIVLLGLMGNA